MDPELKQHLEAMESRMGNRMEAMEARIEARIEDRMGAIVTLVVEVKESLDRQIENVSSRFDAQAIRLDRQAALLQTGARWTNRMIAWSEKIDVELGKRIQEISQLRSRVEKFEGGAK